ncbi:MAG TPA: hypothetical protein VIU12_02525 [Chryseolinea sp.]
MNHHLLSFTAYFTFTKKIIAMVCCLTTLSTYAQSTENWFEFSPGDLSSESSIDMSDWLEKPAGRHGFLNYSGKDFVFEDGTPIKFWGVNIAGNRPFSESQDVKEWTRVLAKFGFNGVRFHKFTWDATDGVNSTNLTPDKWKNFDFFCKSLRDAGIYYSWSHIYGHRVLPGDSARVLAYTEIKNTNFPWRHLNGSTASLVNFADDLQELNIELTTNMLKHVNPHTGKKHAEDPALAFIELQNEDNIFWGAIEETLKQTPTYRALLCKKFSTWLKEKYKTERSLLEAWKNKGLDTGESLEKENIYPHPNHSVFTHEYEQAQKENRDVPTYVADRAAFLYDEQAKFYKKFIKAVRETGYKGVIIGSCWQAGSGITHFYNLHADYLSGPIDRHNYFGGGSGHALAPGKFDNTSMLSKPGSGLLSTGLQQVVDRPFQISEWMSLIPTEWVAESAPIIACYGLGLQGWDASYAFAMDDFRYTKTIQRGQGIYNVTSPTQLALYPALSSMIYRGDLQEGDIIANRNVNLRDLAQGKLRIAEKTSQQYDLKTFESDVPLEALAIGRVTVSFDSDSLNRQHDLSKYWNKQKKHITSSTQQLEWDYADLGYFTINTAGTKGVVGFAKGKDFNLGDWGIKTDNPFAVILITALQKEKALDNTRNVLITTMARAQNSGMVYNKERNVLVDLGAAPILLEPVKVEIQVPKKRKAHVYVLDHNGRRTGKTIASKENKLLIDGTKEHAIYYELEFE